MHTFLFIMSIFGFCAVGVSFLYRMPAGIAGMVNRAENATIEAQIMDPTTPPTLFGVPVKLVSGKLQPIASGDTIANVVVGLLAKPFPMSGTTSEALGAATPNATFPGNLLKRGYMSVVNNASLPAAVPAKGGQAYCRKTAGGAGAGAIGGIESDADSGKCEAITGCFFTGPADASGNVEVAYNL